MAAVYVAKLDVGTRVIMSFNVSCSPEATKNSGFNRAVTAAPPIQRAPKGKRVTARIDRKPNPLKKARITDEVPFGPIARYEHR